MTDEIADRDTQWHSGFYSAMLLRCRDYLDRIKILRELPLATKPLLVDVVIIKIDDGVVMDDAIGRHFRRHNLLEFKSPSDKLSMDDFYKLLAYAALYKSQGAHKDEIKADDITMTLVREGVPRGLINELRALGVAVTESSPGVYNVDAPQPMFRTTIVAYGKMPSEDATWLSALTSRMDEPRARDLVGRMHTMWDDGDAALREAIESVFYVTLEENSELFSRIRGEQTMVKWFWDMMEEGKQEGIAIGEARGEARGIIRMGRRHGLERIAIINDLVSDLSISHAEAERMLEEYNV